MSNNEIDLSSKDAIASIELNLSIGDKSDKDIPQIAKSFIDDLENLCKKYSTERVFISFTLGNTITHLQKKSAKQH